MGHNKNFQNFFWGDKISMKIIFFLKVLIKVVLVGRALELSRVIENNFLKCDMITKRNMKKLKLFLLGVYIT